MTETESEILQWLEGIAARIESLEHKVDTLVRALADEEEADGTPTTDLDGFPLPAARRQTESLD